MLRLQKGHGSNAELSRDISAAMAQLDGELSRRAAMCAAAANSQ
jgi:hypothetical protein